MPIAEQLQHLLRRFAPDEPHWRDVYDLAVLLEQQDVPTVRSLKHRLRQWRNWNAERRAKSNT